MSAKRRLWSIVGNSQRLDGGAMFGNAPRALWQRWIGPDEQNRIPLGCRALLIEEAHRLILVETGIGAFFPPELRERYGVVEPGHLLLENLAAAGFAEQDIDVVLLSHLHFDHAGGLLSPYRHDEPPRLCFPKARYLVGRRAYERARQPHLRDRASFIAELPSLLERSGRLELLEGEQCARLGPDYRLRYSDGHTPGLTLLEVPSEGGPVVFGGDLVPASPWVHLPITMGYDRFPELLVDEKQALLEELLDRGGCLFFTHDSELAMARLRRDERGRFTVGERWAALEGYEA